MVRRAFWVAVGAGFGVGSSYWLTRWVRDTAERYSPERVSSEVSNVVRGLGQDLRDAVAEGREAMRERERDLQHEVGRPSR